MFTGIIEDLGELKKVEHSGDNLVFTVHSKLSPELSIDQSLSHNGICLTVIELEGEQYKVEAIRETLEKSSASSWKIGDSLNLERCMKTDGRFDGHIVQGHVDCTATCTAVEDQNGSFLLSLRYADANHITVEKGSICVNGVSLTVVNSKENEFSVALIPYTWHHTNLQYIKEGGTVNLEFDILGKYIQKMMQSKTN